MMLKYNERINKLKQTSCFLFPHDWYSWLINDWIINQDDRDELMVLLIKLDFDPLRFVKYVVMGEE